MRFVSDWHAEGEMESEVVGNATGVRSRPAGAVLIVLMGLPATGKTTIAHELAANLDGVILSKDRIREAAFPPSVLDYSSAQDDLCMEFAYQAVGYILSKWPERTVVIDGRTYSQRRHVERLLELANALRIMPRFIECVCDEKIIRERLKIAREVGSHPATDRNLELYRALQAQAETLEVPRLTIDTGTLDLREAVARCLDYLRNTPHPPNEGMHPTAQKAGGG